MPDPASGFAATYAEAREKFLDAAAARGIAVRSHVHPVARGAQGEPLAMDVAMQGDPAAPGVLVLISGTHGAEGFCGSGCQVDVLRDDALAARLGKGSVRIVHVHALNPYGFSHLRRTNEDNVDLNRNFRDWSRTPSPNVAYAEVHGFIVPPTWPPSPGNEGRLAAYVKERGERALQSAVSGGQCDFPDGLFYGGVRPAWSNVTLRQVLREHASDARALGWIDFHTGLGPRGFGEKIFAGRASGEEMARAKSWWGDEVTSFHDGTSTSAALSGVNFNAVYEELPGVPCAGIALEYGTLPMMAVMHALRGDQWLANHPREGEPVRAAIKRSLRDAFYQDADDWKRDVVAQARDAVGRAVTRLST